MSVMIFFFLSTSLSLSLMFFLCNTLPTPPMGFAFINCSTNSTSCRLAAFQEDKSSSPSTNWFTRWRTSKFGHQMLNISSRWLKNNPTYKEWKLIPSGSCQAKQGAKVLNNTTINGILTTINGILTLNPAKARISLVARLELFRYGAVPGESHLISRSIDWPESNDLNLGGPRKRHSCPIPLRDSDPGCNWFLGLISCPLHLLSKHVTGFLGRDLRLERSCCYWISDCRGGERNWEICFLKKKHQVWCQIKNNFRF